MMCLLYQHGETPLEIVVKRRGNRDMAWAILLIENGAIFRFEAESDNIKDRECKDDVCTCAIIYTNIHIYIYTYMCVRVYEWMNIAPILSFGSAGWFADHAVGDQREAGQEQLDEAR